jgi:hypothetical protein
MLKRGNVSFASSDGDSFRDDPSCLFTVNESRITGNGQTRNRSNMARLNHSYNELPRLSFLREKSVDHRNNKADSALSHRGHQISIDNLSHFASQSINNIISPHSVKMDRTLRDRKRNGGPD